MQHVVLCNLWRLGWAVWSGGLGPYVLLRNSEVLSCFDAGCPSQESIKLAVSFLEVFVGEG